MEELRVRPASEPDVDEVAGLIHGAPGREAVALLGGEAPARRFGFALTLARGRLEGWDRTLIAEQQGVPVGVLQWRVPSRHARSSRSLALAALRALGPAGTARAWWRERIRRRIDPVPPPDAFHIEEIHAAPRLRGSGIGTRLLAHAETLARDLGCREMSLVTHTENPAQRLYRRMGFEETERRVDPRYLELVG
ncbi:MAG TPA: N-acetyltransferase, partial [Myxococcota bacterium]|nr:N-acetyltransferase [Myxococcota bacterium]